MPDPNGTWTGMAAYLKGLAASLPEPPKAILVISGHWEEQGFAFTGAAQPELMFDYYGFPPETYQLTWPAPGAPWLAERGVELLRAAGLPVAGIHPSRGYDHGVFVPMKVAFPDAAIPTIQMSLAAGLDPALHTAAGKALAPLRDEGVLVLGSGMSFHNLRVYGDPRVEAPSLEFDGWLEAAASAEPEERAGLLEAWEAAPYARFCHPREEHLIPLMVAAGASDAPGERDYGEVVLKGAVSAFRFG
jgi:aromatic ring-opening dioxygenase catalytic subunit (LigB family)